jgi:glycosyltransferase involved in cell wall biosynthesis
MAATAGKAGMTPTLLVSVIIPVWNHAKEASECLGSLKHQTYKNFEVIMVDDGSTDDLEARVAKQNYPFSFQFIRFSENRGAPAARNEGYRHARGNLVMFLDADAVLLPHTLETTVKTLTEHPEADFAYSSFYFGWKLFRSGMFDAAALKRANYIHTSALLRREAFPGFDESLKKFQDWDLWLTIAERGGKGMWIDEPLFRVKPRRDGMSHWLPSFVYRIPWDKLGWMPETVRRYRKAEQVIRQKHNL